MEERIDQFWEAAKAIATAEGPKTKWKQEVSKLRRVLHRNQNLRLAELPQQRLVDTIRLYATHFAAEDDTLLLVKDALAMPFGVLGTKQKKTLLKMHEQLLGNADRNDDDAAPTPQAVWYTCVSMDGDGYLSLLHDDTGEMLESVQVAKKSSEWKTIKKHIDGGNVRVSVLADAVDQVLVVDDDE
ncbi:hypothetical protein DYB37_009087 [Aphanomyces astaci]|uniref:Uncharacterized protein n=2 Tax=Aphanomyces astaci TaxID=112090 RepID=A0A397AMC0_APHAT|nr:hypothetical protein DYB25_014268 [Aphanomyces astaci]RHY58527.1 hypothetical protein DYB34_012007 [Aphanomyces astaci]RHY61048.1 hypothetical protein DYB38_011960 [Aphanomyces astaci]RHY76434.1 hypothetical protein DYB30_012062 [Aphanomyces astaci]RHY88066.1 hypothetical protein DYB26_015338 [Aphanomyces astaci]